MAEQKQPKRRSSGFFRIFERGVDTAARNNVTAMGYSITITAAFALLQTSRSDTGIGSVAGQRLRSDGRLCSLGRTRVNYSALDFE